MKKWTKFFLITLMILSLIGAIRQIGMLVIAVTPPSRSDTQYNPNNIAKTQEVTNINILKLPSSLYEQNYFGQQIKVAVLDTGIDTASSEFNIKAGYNFVSNDNNYQDDNGHGTKMAGIIAAKRNGELMQGISYDSDLYIGKVADSNGNVKFDWLINGIKWAIKEKVNVINISLEFPKDNSELKSVIEKAVRKNIIIVASSGDIKSNVAVKTAYPAKYSNVLSVGMLSMNGTIFSEDFLKRKVDLYAPGENITASYLGNKLTLETNTSAATAYASGLVALEIQKFKSENSSYNYQSIKQDLNSQIHAVYNKNKTNNLIPILIPFSINILIFTLSLIFFIINSKKQ